MISGTDFRFECCGEQVLQAQGADPEIIIRRQPLLLETAQNAVAMGASLVEPWAKIRAFPIHHISDTSIELSSGHLLKSAALADLLQKAEYLWAAILTIGPKPAEKILHLQQQKEFLPALALDAYANLAIESYSVHLIHQLEEQETAKGFFTSGACSPGMIGWPAKEGQLFLFNLLNPDPEKILLNSSQAMHPPKSLSWVIGSGLSLLQQDKPCKHCAMQNRCSYNKEKGITS